MAISKLLTPAVACAALMLAPATPARAQWTTNGVPVVAFSGTQSNPVLVRDGAGGVVIVWQDTRGGNYDIYAQRFNGAGAALWGANGLLVCGATGSQVNPTGAPDGSGGVIIAWQDGRLGPGLEDIHANRVLAGGTLAWADNVMLCGAAGAQQKPAAVSDGAGGAIVAWQDRRDPVNTSWDIYAQRVNGSGTVAAGWTSDGVPLCTADGPQNAPVLVSDGAGGAVVAWVDARMNGNTKTYAQRIAASGAPQWDVDGVVVNTTVNVVPQLTPSLAPNGSGGAIVGYQTWGPDIYAQNYQPNGTYAWGAGSRPVSTATGTQSLPGAASDGAGGAFFVWTDARNASNLDIYAQHVPPDGSLDNRWPGGGFPVCSADSMQANAVIVADGAGGCIIAWEDSRNSTTSDIYATRLTAPGALAHGWSTNGLAVCTASGNQTSPQLVTDDHGGAYVAWTDARNGVDSDIYLQHLSAGGATVDVPPTAVPLGFSATLTSENPTRGGAVLRLVLPREGFVTSRVIDGASGRCIRHLQPVPLGAGVQSVRWDGKDDAGRFVRSGVYAWEVSLGRGVGAVRSSTSVVVAR